MSRTTYSVRTTGPLHYTTSSGKPADVPLGPCLIEQLDGQRADIVWGPSGEKSAELTFKELEAAVAVLLNRGRRQFGEAISRLGRVAQIPLTR